MSKQPTEGDVTVLLQRWGSGDNRAFEELYAVVYQELHGLAEKLMRRERPDHTLQPTALVNEAYLRLAGAGEVAWQNRVQFLRIAARAMRRVLVDHARKHKAGKRISSWQKVEFDDTETPVQWNIDDLLAVDEALERLSELDERQAQIVELRFFAGMTVNEAAAVLELSVATIKREWRMARLWLRRELRSISDPT